MNINFGYYWVFITHLCPGPRWMLKSYLDEKPTVFQPTLITVAGRWLKVQTTWWFHSWDVGWGFTKIGSLTLRVLPPKRHEKERTVQRILLLFESPTYPLAPFSQIQRSLHLLAAYHLPPLFCHHLCLYRQSPLGELRNAVLSLHQSFFSDYHKNKNNKRLNWAPL